MEKPTIDALNEDEDFRSILNAHISKQKPKSASDRISSTSKPKDITFPSELSNLTKTPEKIWISDTKMVNSESAIIEFDGEIAKEPSLTDMVICMGGDGTLLHVASIFQV